MVSQRTRVLRGVPYLLAALPSSMAALLAPFVLIVAALAIVIGGAGLLLVPLGLLVLRGWTDLNRLWAGSVLRAPVPLRFRPLRGGVFGWWRTQLTDPTTYRDLLWLPVQVVLGLPLGLFTLVLVMFPFASVIGMFFWWVPDNYGMSLVPDIPITDWKTAFGTGLPALLLSSAMIWWLVPPLAHGWAWVNRAVLDRSGTEQLEERVDELTETRAGAIDSHGAELRRIERDLHDGTQAKLVSIALRLGIARQTLRDEPETAAALLKEASEGTEAAMGELRTIVRTIYPPILSDRGLIGALRSLVADSGVPAHADLEEVGPLPAAVEAAAYFVVSEALTNVAKHAEANFAVVKVRLTGDRLDVEVTDNGKGGIDETRGSGVNGIRRRVAALDGTTTVLSPPGGPTSILVELPCAR
ncbi:sensor histidine kinase [Amycolatopsis anabasis]|uniref:sensor histidine kinase n=1 Tax=Amycolatopsis anabasis TaxID=1840409 RepID=UPI001C550C26|nr:sensor histidine kinase [Amycolatopsis anabasis]